MPNRHSGFYDFEHHARAVDIGRAQDRRELDAASFDHKMALRAQFVSIRWIHADFALPTASTVNESTEAFDNEVDGRIE
jgi:hypothetical protein